jgi:hypothetical protein
MITCPRRVNEPKTIKSNPLNAVPVKATLTVSWRDDGGEIVRVIVESSAWFVISLGEAETLMTDCAGNKPAPRNIARPSRIRAKQSDRVFMTFYFRKRTSIPKEDFQGL